MNDQCNECKIRKMCYREEPEEDWTCEYYEPCDDLSEEMEEIEEEEGRIDIDKLLDQLFKNNQKLLESNQRLININEKLVEVNNGWKDTVDKMFTLLTTPREEPEKGKWITGVEAAGEKGFACDQCKTFFPYKYYGETHKFCPHCGADMRREQNEHDGQRDKGMAEKVSAAPTGDTGY